MALFYASYAGKSVTSQNAEAVWMKSITGEAYKTGLEPLTAVTAGITSHRWLGIMNNWNLLGTLCTLMVQCQV